MTECNACGVPAPAIKKSIFISLPLFSYSVCLQSIISHTFYLNLHDEWCIMTGNCGVCGLLRDVSCFREEIQHKQELARANAVKKACGGNEEAGWGNVKLPAFTHDMKVVQND